MTNNLPEVSVTAPVGWALSHVKKVLFKPFDLSKWFIIGFCAWLAYLGEGGGNFNFNFNSGQRYHAGHGTSYRDMMDEAGHWISQNLNWIIPAAIVLLVLGLIVGVLIMWLSSRDRFMFLHCVALDVAEVKRPWAELACEANSLFWFRLVLGIITMILCLPLAVGLVVVVGRMLYYEKAEGGQIAIAIACVLVLFVLTICFALIQKFTKDFVVPIMYLHHTRCTDAWREFLDLFRDNVGRFALYILFQIVLVFIIGFIVMAIILATCCTAGCLFAVPYIGTVVLLPVLVFKRSYSIYYLAQYGSAYDVFPPEPPPAPAVLVS